MKVFSANIKNNPDMPDAHVRHDIRKIKQWMKRWDVGFWQEIGEDEDHRAIKDIFKRLYFYHLFPGRPTPITVRKSRWKVLETIHYVAHTGKAGVSPNRGFSVAILQHRWLRFQIAVICTHFVSKAWSDPNASHKDWRQARWLEHFSELQSVVMSLNARGISTLVAGDWNRRKEEIEKMTPDQKWLVSDWYDHIAWCPAPNDLVIDVKKRRVYTDPLYTDHDPVAAVFSLGR